MVLVSITKLKEYLDDDQIRDMLGVPERVGRENKPIDLKDKKRKSKSKPKEEPNEVVSKYTYEEVIQKSIEIQEEFEEEDADAILNQIKEQLGLEEFADIQEKDYDRAIEYFNQELAD